MGDQTAVTLGAMTTVTDPTPSETLPVPGGIWFFVTIGFNPSAVAKLFTVSAVTPPDNITSDAGTVDGGIGAGGAVFVGKPPVTAIPVGLEWIAGLFFLGYMLYTLERRRRA